MTVPNDPESAAPTGAEPPPSPGPGGPPPGNGPEEPEENGSQDELKAFMEEYRADKAARAEAERAAAEAAAKKKTVPAPKPKAKPKDEEKPVPETAEPPAAKAYGSARYFNRKPKVVKE